MSMRLRGLRGSLWSLGEQKSSSAPRTISCSAMFPPGQSKQLQQYNTQIQSLRKFERRISVKQDILKPVSLSVVDGI